MQLGDLVLPLCVNTVLLPLLFIVQSTHRELERRRLAAFQRSERWFKPFTPASRVATVRSVLGR